MHELDCGSVVRREGRSVRCRPIGRPEAGERVQQLEEWEEGQGEAAGPFLKDHVAV